MDEAKRHQIAMGIGIALALLSIFLPTVCPTMPQFVAWLGLFVSALFFIWGMWPILASLRMGHVFSWHIPLLEAARICHEKSEGFPVGNLVARTQDTPHQKLSYFVASFIGNDVPMYGEKPPSTVALKIPSGETRGLIAKEGTQDFMSLYDSKVIAYKNVFLKRSDLSRHLRYLRRLNSDEQVKKWFG